MPPGTLWGGMDKTLTNHVQMPIAIFRGSFLFSRALFCISGGRIARRPRVIFCLFGNYDHQKHVQIHFILFYLFSFFIFSLISIFIFISIYSFIYLYVFLYYYYSFFGGWEGPHCIATKVNSEHNTQNKPSGKSRYCEQYWVSQKQSIILFMCFSSLSHFRIKKTQHAICIAQPTMDTGLKICIMHALERNKVNAQHCLVCCPHYSYKQIVGNGKLIDPCSLTIGSSHLCQTTYDYIYTKGSQKNQESQLKYQIIMKYIVP